MTRPQMQISWDMSVYGKMGPDIQQLVDTSKEWLCSHAALSQRYILRVSEEHPALWFTGVMREVESDIDRKVQDAVDLGCLYVIELKRSPFGKIHKSNVLVRLKRNHELGSV